MYLPSAGVVPGRWLQVRGRARPLAPGMPLVGLRRIDTSVSGAPLWPAAGAVAGHPFCVNSHTERQQSAQSEVTGNGEGIAPGPPLLRRRDKDVAGNRNATATDGAGVQGGQEI